MSEPNVSSSEVTKGQFVKFGGKYKIWLPQGWTLGGEPDLQSGEPRPVWYRLKKPQGSVRMDLLSSGDKDPGGLARETAEKLAQSPGVENLNVVEKGNRLEVSWREIIQEPQVRGLTASRVWLIVENEKTLQMTYSYEAKIEGKRRFQRELAEVKDIASKSAPL